MQARKRFGQHFLTDPAVLQQIVQAVAPRAEDCIFEVGPGHGALTDLLVPRVGAYLAVEVDRDLVPLLRARHPAMTVVNEDVLRSDLPALLAAQPRAAWRVLGNLPYNISSPILLKFLQLAQTSPGTVTDLHFMLQKEMADRLCAVPGTKAWSRLSVLIQLFFRQELLFDVEPGSFAPPPKVRSSVIRLLPRATTPTAAEVTSLQTVLRLAFSARRKRLSNSLKQLQLDWVKVTAELGLDPGMRADDVDKEQFLGIARMLPAGAALNNDR